MAVVIDDGTLKCKAGIAGDTRPRLTVQSCVGYSEGNPQPVFCDEAWARRRELSLRYPIEDGLIQHWDEMELVWNHIFRGLGVKPSAQPVMLTETPLNPPLNREQAVQVMFEHFEVPAMYMASQPLLSTSHFGLTSALVVKIGTDSCSAVPVYQGHPQYLAIENASFGGRDLSNYLMAVLAENNKVTLDPANWDDWDGIVEIKERMSYCALDPQEELGSFTKLGSEVLRPYTFKNGKKVVVGPEQFMSSEPLFRPSLLGSNIQSPSLSELVASAIGKCDTSMQNELWNSVFLLGGTTQQQGLPNRLHRELAALAPSGQKIQVITPRHGDIDASFIGASKLAASDQFVKMCITKEEYEEVGPSAVHKKCL